MTDFPYDIVRSPKRRKLTIMVERDRAVVVRAPVNVSDGEIARVVNTKRQWILEKLRHPQKYQNRQHPPGKEVVNGESALYLGRDYRIEIADTPSGKVEFDHQFRVPPKQQGNRRKVLRDWYVARAKDEIVRRAAQHARSLGCLSTPGTRY
jgi:predicted metal-dependent hydrolase